MTLGRRSSVRSIAREERKRRKRPHRLKAALVARTGKLIVGDGKKMIYTKEALEAARFAVVGKPDTLEQAYINGWNDALEAVRNNAGSVSRETTGHWITDQYAFFLVCSNCDRAINREYGEVFLESDSRYNYCPHCGVRMTDERPDDKS